jgi:Fe2+ transport system protein B
MAKAKKAEANPSMFSPIIDGIKDTVVGVVGRMVKEKIMQLEKMVLEIALSFVFLAVAIFFFLAALVFFLREYAQLTYTVSFLCVGIIALVIAFIIYKIVGK